MRTCKRGHEYDDSKKRCPTCKRAANDSWARENVAKAQASRTKWRNANRAKAREATRRWKQSAEEKRLAYPRALMKERDRFTKVNRRIMSPREIEEFRRAWLAENVEAEEGKSGLDKSPPT